MVAGVVSEEVEVLEDLSRGSRGLEACSWMLPQARDLTRPEHGGQGDGEARGDLPGSGEGKRGTEVDEGN